MYDTCMIPSNKCYHSEFIVKQSSKLCGAMYENVSDPIDPDIFFRKTSVPAIKGKPEKGVFLLENVKSQFMDPLNLPKYWFSKILAFFNIKLTYLILIRSSCALLTNKDKIGLKITYLYFQCIS